MSRVSSRALMVTALFFSMVFAGCTADPSPDVPAPDENPILVTDPTDFSYLEEANGTDRPHLHDYWGEEDTLTVLSTTGRAQAGFWGTPEGLPLERFWPEPGDVVPLGTAYLEITVSWTENPDATYGEAQLWIKSAADAEPSIKVPVGQGDTIRVDTTNEMADLPHQTLSGWAFDFAATPDDTLGFGRFDGQVTLDVTAHKGLEIPLFPGHPDRWDNATELALIAVEDDVPIFQGDPGGGACAGGCIIFPYQPTGGALVPHDADHVTMELRYEQRSPSPTDIEVWFHGADRRSFVNEDLVETEGSWPGEIVKRYTVPLVGAMPDGPYANASQWEFRIVAMTPDPPYGTWSGSFNLTAVVHRDAA